MHIAVACRLCHVWRTRTDEEFCRRDISHIDVERSVEGSSTTLYELTEVVACRSPCVSTEDRAVGEVVVS